jgi:hypothetical protein
VSPSHDIYVNSSALFYCHIEGSKLAHIALQAAATVAKREMELWNPEQTLTIPLFLAHIGVFAVSYVKMVKT